MASARHFTLIVAGKEAESTLDKYDSGKHIEKVVVYKAKDAEKLYNERKKVLKGFIKLYENDETRAQFYKDELDYMDSIEPLEYYIDLTEDFDIDKDTGDAYEDRNPNGKYEICQLGGNFALPFKTLDGKETYEAVKKDVDWSKMHHANREVYESAWDCVMEGKKPETDEEKVIYENMKNRTAYFKRFGTREKYVEFSTAFWGYAFLSEKTGWVELDYSIDQYKWVSTFYDEFIKPLPEDTVLMIYECRREEEADHE